MKKVYRISKEFIEVRDKHGRHVDPIDAYVNATAHDPEIIEEYTNRTDAREAWARKYTTPDTLRYNPFHRIWVGKIYLYEEVTLDDNGEEVAWDGDDETFPIYPPETDEDEE